MNTSRFRLRFSRANTVTTFWMLSIDTLASSSTAADDRREVIIQQNHIGGLSCDIAAHDSHCVPIRQLLSLGRR